MVLCGAACVLSVICMAISRRRERLRQFRLPVLAFCLFAALGFLASAAEGGGDNLPASLEIKRNEPGDGAFETEAYFSLDGEETQIPITLTVEERQMEKQEEESMLSAAKEEIRQTFCGKNSSISEISSDPVILEAYQDGRVLAEWSFSERGIFSADGQLSDQAGKKGRRDVEAYVALSCGRSEDFYRFSFRIVPKEQGRTDKLKQEVFDALESQDETKEVIRLPGKIAGQQAKWHFAPSVRPMEFLGLGLLAAVAAGYAAREQEQKKKEKRKRGLLLSYPEFVNKLSLLLGAGMSISGALRKMNLLYRKRRENGGKEEAAYEELAIMLYEIDNGMGELRAYQSFAGKCGLQPYRKLSSMLISGQRVGNGRLAVQLNEEADRVFLERKNAARKLGEEAGTKLLLPMMLMLLIVMGIVMIPAFLSIYGS